MLDLLIISPNSADLYQKLQIDFSAKEPNVWAGLLANAVRSQGFGVAIYDMEIEQPTPDQFLKDVESYDAKLILFVVTGQNPNASTAAMSGAVSAAEILSDLDTKIAFVGVLFLILNEKKLRFFPNCQAF